MSRKVLLPATARNGPDQPQSSTIVPKPNAKEQLVLPRPISIPKPPPSQSQPKKVARRSSKPILHWFQRKLAGTVRTTKRASGDITGMGSHPGRGKSRALAAPSFRERVVSAPGSSAAATASSIHSNGIKLETLNGTRRKTISLNEGDDGYFIGNADEESAQRSTRSSAEKRSTSPPASTLEADDDASMRPIPPSGPPSPSPSRSSSYWSRPHTFKSMAASTKPTTLLSIDLTPNGMAHIAQAPPTPLSQNTRVSQHARSSSTGTTGALRGSGTSMTFSALPPSTQSSRPSSLQHTTSISSSHPSAPSANGHITSVQAPLHTTHHPRNNPRPSSPPMDDASVFTLASSAFAHAGSRMGSGLPGWASGTPSAMGEDSISHFTTATGEGDADGDVGSVLGDDDQLEERDIAASVRALRPRSSRRGSWDSEVSGWSAGIGMGALGTPSLARERWTANSVRTGGQFSADNDQGFEDDSALERVSEQTHQSRYVIGDVEPVIPHARALPGPFTMLLNGDERAPAQISPLNPGTSEVIDTESSPTKPEQPLPDNDGNHPSSTGGKPSLDVVDGQQPTEMSDASFDDTSLRHDTVSFATADNDVYHSAPSTPIRENHE